MQYLVGSGIINTSPETRSNSDSNTHAPASSTLDTDAAQCDSAATPSDKQTCLDAMQTERDLKAKIASTTPFVMGPLTYYVVSTDLINTGDVVF